MSNPILFFVAVLVIDLVLKSLKSKKKAERDRNIKTPDLSTSTRNTKPQVEEKKSGSTLRDLRRIMEEEFERQSGKTKSIEPSREAGIDDTPVKRAMTAKSSRDRLIEKQKEKINKHSELERSRRLVKEEMNTRARLSDSQVPLASQGLKGKMDDYDFTPRKPSLLGVQDTSKTKAGPSSQGLLNIKEDILKGIIYSEILSAPKSLKK